MRDFLIKTAITAYILYCAGCIGYVIKANEAINEPVSLYFWIDNDRFMKDSQINPRPIYNELGELIGSNIRIRNTEGDTYKEFLDSEKGAWKINRDSWIIAFKKGVGEW